MTKLLIKVINIFIKRAIKHLLARLPDKLTSLFLLLGVAAALSLILKAC